jgi:hypothetical protein
MTVAPKMPMATNSISGLVTTSALGTRPQATSLHTGEAAASSNTKQPKMPRMRMAMNSSWGGREGMGVCGGRDRGGEGGGLSKQGGRGINCRQDAPTLE